MVYNVAMLNITNTIENALYSYEPNEFLPIYVDNELANRRQFVAYKIGRAATPIYDKMLTLGKNIVGIMDDAIERSNESFSG